MKKSAWILLTLLLAGTWHAQSQVVHQQYIEGEIHSLVVSNHNNVNVMLGDRNTVRVTESYSDAGKLVSVSDGVVKIFSEGFATVDLIVRPSTLGNVKVDNFGTVTVPLTALRDSAVLRSQKHGSLIVSAVTRKNDTRIGTGAATLDGTEAFRSLTLEASEFGMLNVKPPVNSHHSRVSATEHSSVHIAKLDGVTAEVYASEFGNIAVKNGTIDTVWVKYREFGSVDVGNITTKYNTVAADGANDVAGDKSVVVPLVENVKPDYRRIYDFGDRFSIAFYLGWSKWGAAPYSSFIGMDGAWDSKLMYWDFAIEENYAVVRHFNWMFQVGIGFDANYVRLNNHYVFVNENNDGNGTLVIGDNTDISSNNDITGDLANPYLWKTRVAAGYLTLPLRIARTNRDNDYSIGISLVPGVAVSRSIQHMITNEEVKGSTIDYRSTDQEKHYLNPVMLDLRLDALMHDAIGVYVQTGLLPMTRNLDNKAYSFSFGFKFGF